MGIFFPKKRASPPPVSPPDRSTPRLMTHLGAVVAKRLSTWEKKLSHKQRKFAFILILALASMVFMTDLYSGLYSKPVQPSTFLAKPGISTAITPRIPDSLFLKLQRLKQLHIDSLPASK